MKAGKTKNKKTPVGLGSELVLKNIDEVIYYVTLDGGKRQMVFLSDKIKDILGVDKKKYLELGKKIIEHCHPKDIPAITRNTNEVIKKKEKRVFQYRFFNPKKKAYVWIEETIYPQLNEKNKLLGFFGVSRNITAEKQKEEELNQRWLNYRDLIESLPTGIFIHVNGKIIFGNKEAYRIADFKKNERLDKVSLLDFLSEEDRPHGKDRIKQAMSGKDTPFTEYTITTHKGTKRIIRTKSSPIVYNSSQAVQIIIIDMTREKQLEEARVKTKITEQLNKGLKEEVALRMQSEEKLKAIFNSSSHLIWTINKEMEITSFNDRYAEIVYKQCGLVLRKGSSITQFKKFFSAKEYKNFTGKYAKAFKGKTQQFEIKFTAVDGTERYREIFLHPVRVKGKVTEVAGIAQDITDRKNDENRITEQAAKLKAIFESTTHLIWTVNRNKEIISYNKNYKDTVKNLCGVELKTGMPASLLKHVFTEEDYKLLQESQIAAFKGKNAKIEIPLHAINGKTYYREMHFHPIMINGTVAEIAAVAQDTTKRREHEKQITEQSAKLKAIFDSGNRRIWTINKNFEFTSFNDNFSRAYEISLGVKPKIGESVLKHVKDTEYDGFWKGKYEEALRGKSLGFETKHPGSDGKTRYGQIFLHPIITDNGKVTEIAAISQDISDRKNAEKQIIEQSSRLKAIFESGSQLMWTVNRNLALTSFNKNYSDSIHAMYGVYPEINTDLNKPRKKFAPEEYHAYWEEKYRQAFKGESIEFDTERQTLSGEKIFRHIFLHPIYNERNEVTEISGIAYDITAQKQAQEEILNKQSQLAAIINTTGDIIFSVDKECRLVEFNEVLRDVVKDRHKVDIKPGDSIFDVLPPRYHDEVRARYQAAFGGHSILAIEQFDVAGRKRNYEAHYKPIIKDGNVTGVAVFSRDVTEQQEAKEEIINKQSQLATIINTTDDIILSIDKKYRVVEYNEVMREIAFLRTGKEIKAGLSFFDFLPKEQHADLKKTYDKAMNGENVVSIEMFFHPKTKVNRIYEAHYNPIKINGEITGIAIFSRDITEREKASYELMDKQSRLSAIINNTNDIILSIDRDFNLIEYNEILQQLVKHAYGKDLKPGSSVFDALHPGHHAEMRAIYNRVFNGESVSAIGRFGTGESQTTFETHYNPIRTGEKITGIAIFSRDITQQKKSEEDVLKSLKEKDVLLKEVHHRVKNNLQVISSILNLQTAYLKDRATIDILKECQNRIKTMAFIHESLYQNKDFSQINFSEYIVTLVKNLFYSFEANQQKIRPNFDVEPILLNLDISIPCGLIVNELVSNALKYAFKEKGEGAVFIELKKIEGKIKMVIGDNGSGIPENVNFRNTETLGLQLVNTLTEQINGTITMKRNKGTIFEIIF